jgi:hypothetical protein
VPPLPVITLQGREGSKPAAGWYSHQRWEQPQLHNLLPEINLCPEELGGDLLEIGHTMIHEMVHYANAHVGLRDCNANHYHNRHFKELAEEVGLDCGRERHPRIGWGNSRLTPLATERIEAIGLDQAAFTLIRRQRPVEAIQAKPKLIKWCCTCDPVWRAAGREPMAAGCRKCLADYQPANQRLRDRSEIPENRLEETRHR